MGIGFGSRYSVLDSRQWWRVEAGSTASGYFGSSGSRTRGSGEVWITPASGYFRDHTGQRIIFGGSGSRTRGSGGGRSPKPFTYIRGLRGTCLHHSREYGNNIAMLTSNVKEKQKADQPDGL
jgi:hypothetical protein